MFKSKSSATFSCGFHVYSSPRENVILFKQVQRTVKLQLYVISNSSFLNFKSQLTNPRKFIFFRMLAFVIS